MIKRLLIAAVACLVLAAPALAEEETEVSQDVLEVTGKIFDIRIKDAEVLEEADNYGTPVEPEKGEVFLAVKFEAKNISDEDDYFNRLNFIAYADDFEVELTNYKLEEADMMTGDIVAGKGMRGCLIFSVPEDWEIFEVYYEESYGADKLRMAFSADSDILE